MQQNISVQLGIAWVVVALIIGIMLLVTAPPQTAASRSSLFRANNQTVSYSGNDAVRTSVQITDPIVEQVQTSAIIKR